MILLYFSGTGNSKYIADKFSQKMGAECYSIEEKFDFKTIIEANTVLAFCYPIYGACVPRIMREFVETHKEILQQKKIIILCTQMMFSGDGSHALYRLLPENNSVLYAEHFNMPNNISNLWFFPIKEKERKRKVVLAEKKLTTVCSNINKGVVKRRGWSKFSRFLGMLQNVSWPAVEIKKANSFDVNTACTQCGLCVKQCPVQNLALVENTVTHTNNCMLCYRCVNNCPKKSISVLISPKPKVQYKGPKKQ